MCRRKNSSREKMSRKNYFKIQRNKQKKKNSPSTTNKSTNFVPITETIISSISIVSGDKNDGVSIQNLQIRRIQKEFCQMPLKDTVTVRQNKTDVTFKSSRM